MAAKTRDDFDLGRTLAWLLFGVLATGIAFTILYGLAPEGVVQTEERPKIGGYALQEVPDDTPPWRRSDKAPEPVKLSADLR